MVEKIRLGFFRRFSVHMGKDKLRLIDKLNEFHTILQ